MFLSVHEHNSLNDTDVETEVLRKGRAVWA